ncbi:PEP-CTERM sorting domain-containing protein [Roseateles amylovorans]|uniref:PEP-CTERM sorting domain-containing protein n=1 Tax=Roseateles amylovorans TaxID=2978473 RepID=A0ABY6B1D1_9BURK|nr:PEP-CTERM sorting domain-containing protein [Roseateles amylovorans]UXH77794.1 PEP-CTERM sorting domain-containing protein [Roseateles amylovorans]
MKSPFVIAAGWALALSAAGTSPSVLAATFEATSTATAAGTLSSTQRDGTTQHTNGALSSTSALLTESSAAGNLSHMQTSAWSQAGYGYVQAFSQSSTLGWTNGSGLQAEAYASATASSQDAFTIQCAACTVGSYGWAVARVLVSGSASLDGRINQQAFNSVNSGSTNQTLSLTVTADGVDNDPSNPTPPTSLQRVDSQNHFGASLIGYGWGAAPGYHDIVFKFVFGQAVHLDLQAATFSSARVSLESDAPGLAGWETTQSDLTSGLTWAGLAAVTTVDGQAINAFSALNSFGTNYARSFVAGAVPEPSSWALMAAGLLAILGFGRSRQATRTRELADARLAG